MTTLLMNMVTFSICFHQRGAAFTQSVNYARECGRAIFGKYSKVQDDAL